MDVHEIGVGRWALGAGRWALAADVSVASAEWVGASPPFFAVARETRTAGAATAGTSEEMAAV
jgi:hypothetical protein